METGRNSMWSITRTGCSSNNILTQILSIFGFFGELSCELKEKAHVFAMFGHDSAHPELGEFQGSLSELFNLLSVLKRRLGQR